MRRIPFTLVAVLAVVVGMYPILYFLVDMNGGLMATKPLEVPEGDCGTPHFISTF